MRRRRLYGFGLVALAWSDPQHVTIVEVAVSVFRAQGLTGQKIVSYDLQWTPYKSHNYTERQIDKTTMPKKKGETKKCRSD